MCMPSRIPFRIEFRQKFGIGTGRPANAIIQTGETAMRRFIMSPCEVKLDISHFVLFIMVSMRGAKMHKCGYTMTQASFSHAQHSALSTCNILHIKSLRTLLVSFHFLPILPGRLMNHGKQTHASSFFISTICYMEYVDRPW